MTTVILLAAGAILTVGAGALALCAAAAHADREMTFRRVMRHGSKPPFCSTAVQRIPQAYDSTRLKTDRWLL
jgi:hypothetical protein